MFDLELLAKQVMQQRGLEPHFSDAALKQLAALTKPATPLPQSTDLRELLWCSIDNDDSRDLDQLTYAQQETDGTTTLWIAIADVDALVPKGSPIDLHAQANTTSVYTPAKIFHMLPEKLSTNLTSLNEHEDRLALVIKVNVSKQGDIKNTSAFQAVVRNHAKLSYNGLAAWLDGKGPVPEKVKQVAGLEQTLRCQNEMAQVLENKRHELGALTLESSEIEAKVSEKKEVILESPSYNNALELIQNFMVIANHVMATYLQKANIPSIRRVVRIPKRWERIVEIAASFKHTLPKEPDSKALEEFLEKRKKADPVSFPDLSLTIIKLLGRGEYIVERPGDKPIGHFGLALSEYTHSTAPNRRFPDLITQRQFKATLRGEKTPYSLDELEMLARHCTDQENAVNKVERQMSKVAEAMLLSTQIGTIYKGIVTGASAKGTWARIFSPPVEGKIVKGFEKLDVGDRVTVQLVSVDIPRGFINFTLSS